MLISMEMCDVDGALWIRTYSALPNRCAFQKAYLSVWLCTVRIALCPVLPKMRGIYNIPLALKYHPFFLLFHAWDFFFLFSLSCFLHVRALFTFIDFRIPKTIVYNSGANLTSRERCWACLGYNREGKAEAVEGRRTATLLQWQRRVIVWFPKRSIMPVERQIGTAWGIARMPSALLITTKISYLRRKVFRMAPQERL